VYTTLGRLERDGLVDADDGAEGPQRTYRLTSSGALELDDWLRSPPDMSAPPRDELVIKVLIALRLADVDLRELLQVHRRKLVELMQQYTRLKQDTGDDDLSLTLVVDSELFRLDSLIRWLDAVDARLPAAAAERPEHRGMGSRAATGAMRTVPERLGRRIGGRR
jgi:DNA-binding PadR family transcriptional regulator